MKKFIYESDFKVGPKATKKQEMLFTTDLEFAISEGYEFIQPKDGPVLKVVAPNELVEVNVTEEELQKAADLALQAEPSEVELDSTDEDDSEDEDSEEYCVHCHNLMLIDQIINNTLSKKEDITPQQADTMLKLAKLSQMLQGVE